MHHTKFETKSNRVKGLSFHNTRPWILASLHNGVIQLWDYRIKCLAQKYEEHIGPVRGINFHGTQPLFVSGGDDNRIKVWNYKKHRCLFTLQGHLDYIRTVQFHPGEQPWILSSSDDQTIRIWNWQSRTCVGVLTGHNHYVMCASFHPREDIVVSASLDQTVRVWDISGLRKKTVAPKAFAETEAQRLQSDLFGGTDALVKFVLEGHDRGVNWAAFHPTAPFIVSAADDRQVKLWRMSDTKAWELDTFRGHFNNVSCALFHPKYEVVISNSEDKTIRIWDQNKRIGLQTIRRDIDRFWILAAHPTQNLLAAGHDSGLVMFKLSSERPGFTTTPTQLVYTANSVLRLYDFTVSRDVPLLHLKKNVLAGPIISQPSSISYSPADASVVVCYKIDGGYYELYTIPRDGRNIEGVEAKRMSNVLGAVFIGRKRLLTLDKASRQLVVRDLTNVEVKRINAVSPTVDQLFPGPMAGTVLLRAEDKVILYDVEQRKCLAELTINGVRAVVWSQPKNTHVAFLTKDMVVITTRNLEQTCAAHEIIRIKSGAWDENGVFLYSTLSHLKYLLPNGDNGIVRTLDIPLYVTSIRGNKVICLDRECKNRVVAVNPTEYLFKLALVQHRYSDVMSMIQSANLLGQAIIGYLQSKGFPEIALQFVHDDATRFTLALECGNIDVALESAKALNNKESWLKLAAAALRQGNHQVVEMAYQRTKDFSRLAFLYLITGNTEKLSKMLAIAKKRNDVEGEFHTALYLGDLQDRLTVIADVANMPNFARTVAQIHGLHNTVEELDSKYPSSSTVPKYTPPSAPTLLLPPMPVMRSFDSNWPLLTVSKGWQDALHAAEESSKFTPEATTAAPADQPEGGWADSAVPEELAEAPEIKEEVAQTVAPVASEGDGWVIEGLEDIPDVQPTTTTAATPSGKFYSPPTPGISAREFWLRNSTLAIDHAASSSFGSAMKLLTEQVGVVNFAPLQQNFVFAAIGSHCVVPGIGSLYGMTTPLHRNTTELNPTHGGGSASTGLPALCVSGGVAPLAERLKLAYNSFTKGAFSEALGQFQSLLTSILVAVVNSKQDVDELKELIEICREYIIGITLEVKRKEIAQAKGDAARQIELAAYFTHCNIQLFHLTLVLRSAMNCAYQLKNFGTAMSFAKRLLELNPKPDVATMAQKIIRLAEQNSTNASKLNYDERNPFSLCCISFTPIYRNTPSVSCPFCRASYLPKNLTSDTTSTCTICGLSSPTMQSVTGLQVSKSR